MKGLKWLALACVGGGIGLLAYGASTGTTEAGLFLVFPVVFGEGLAAFGGTLLIIAGVFLGMMHLATAYAPEPGEAAPETSGGGGPAVKTGGVLFLGPIPVVFGSDRKVTTAMLILAIVLTILLIGLLLMALRP